MQKDDESNRVYTSIVRCFEYTTNKDLCTSVNDHFQLFGTLVEFDAVFDTISGSTYVAAKWEKEVTTKLHDLWVVDGIVPTEYRLDSSVNCPLHIWFSRKLELIHRIRTEIQQGVRGRVTTTAIKESDFKPKKQDDDAKHKSDDDFKIHAFDVQDIVDDKKKRYRSTIRCFAYDSCKDLTSSIQSMVEQTKGLEDYAHVFDQKSNTTYIIAKWNTNIDSQGYKKWSVSTLEPREYRRRHPITIDDWYNIHVAAINHMRNAIA